jgi:ligand-binding sensor domain-containing protein
MKMHCLPASVYLLLSVFPFFVSCNEQNNNYRNIRKDAPAQITVSKAVTNNTVLGRSITTEIDDNIRSIFQDKNGIYWFGTNAAGVYRYDPKQAIGKRLTQFTEKDGLANNQVQSIQEDNAGNIWFGTGGFGVSRYEPGRAVGQTFPTFTTEKSAQLSSNSAEEWKSEPNDLWFYAGGGVHRYDGNKLTYLPFPKPDFDAKYSPNPPERLSRYAVYSMLKDTKGNLWFGTQAMGVCCYDGKSFTWFTEKGLTGPAVLGLFEDKNGNIWFGNNGAGLFRYDSLAELRAGSKTLTNFTEEKGLSNKEFRASGKSNLGTLARIYSINEDTAGNLWIGTVDAGVWRYDGKILTNYTTKDGLTSNAVNTIYKDRKGELWFGTDGNGVCKFNGLSFTKFVVR